MELLRPWLRRGRRRERASEGGLAMAARREAPRKGSDHGCVDLPAGMEGRAAGGQHRQAREPAAMGGPGARPADGRFGREIGRAHV